MTFIIFIISYLIGALPLSYFIVKIISGKDITSEGSGNVGTLNAYLVTKNKIIGISILLFDVLKAIFALWIIKSIFGITFQHITVASIGVLIGHKFNIFLKFKGGIGLASALGLVLMINYLPLLIWGIVWVIGKIITKNMDKSIISASIFSIILIWIMPESYLNIFNSCIILEIKEIRILISIINILILLSPIFYKDKTKN